MNIATTLSPHLPVIALFVQVISCVFLAVKGAQFGRRLKFIPGLAMALAFFLAGFCIKMIALPGLPIQDFVNQSLTFWLIAFGLGIFAAQDRRV